MRTKSVLTLEDARSMINAAKEEAAKNTWNVSIAVVDEGGYLIALERMDGASLPSAEIAQGKACTSALFRSPTKTIEDTVKERPAMLALCKRTPVQGAVPVMHEGQCIGGIGVSGVKSHEDEQVAAAGAKALG